MAVDIKQVSRSILEEVFGKGRLEVLDQACDPSYKGHDPLTGESDIAGLKRDAQMYRDAFPDLKMSVVGICAEGDTVCTHWRCTGTHRKTFLGVAPTGKKITVEGLSFDRFRNGKVVESFTQWDTLGFLQALGIVPKLQLEVPEARPERRPHA